MYCPSCGKEIPDKSAFCLHCGKATPTTTKPTQANTDWECIYFSWDWKPGTGGRYPIGTGQSEQLVRLQNWGEDQSQILPNLQQYLDKGWEPVSEVGPMSYVFRRNKDYLSVAAFRVKLRRPRTSTIPPYHSKLIGKWQVSDVQTKGIYKLALGVGGMLGVIPKEYTFSKDNTYQVVSKNLFNGIYSFPNEQTVKLIPDPPMLDSLSYSFKWNANDIIFHEMGNVPVDIRLRKVK